MAETREHIKHKNKQDEIIAQRVNELSALLNISNYVGSVMELDDILQLISKETAEVMNVNVSSIYLYNHDRTRLVLKATYGLNPQLINVSGFLPGESLPGWVVQHNTTVSVPNAVKDPRFKQLAEDSYEQPLKAYMGAPLRIQDEIIGVMTVRMVAGHVFTPEEITFLETICKQVAIVIEKSRLYFEKMETERLAAIGQSLSETAHYIKNILQSMKGGSFFIESGVKRKDYDRILRGWEVLKSSNKKIADLVKNMLGFSRTTKPKLAPADLNELILEILSTVEDSADVRVLNIDPQLTPDLPEVMIDSMSIHDALLNIITNAVDAIPKEQKGTIHIRTVFMKEENRIMCEIEDNGRGIAEKNKSKIFSLFYSTKGTHGTGIGLAVTRKIIEEHGGAIEFVSEEGKGTTFRIFLPVNSNQK